MKRRLGITIASCGALLGILFIASPAPAAQTCPALCDNGESCPRAGKTCRAGGNQICTCRDDGTNYCVCNAEAPPPTDDTGSDL